MELGQGAFISYAHQGGAWEAPSSTLFAITRALELGASGIELDVHRSADGILVVCHDATVDRTTDGSGAIAQLTLAELRQLDNAYWWAPGADVSPGLEEASYPYRGMAPDDVRFAVATLDEVLEVLEDYPEVALNLDIKATAPTVPPYERELAEALQKAGRVEGVIVASFIDSATEAFASHAPEIAISAGTAVVTAFWQMVNGAEDEADPDLAAELERYAALQVPAVYGELVVVDERFVEAAHEAALAVHVWTINDEAEMRRLLALGVDGIFTDLPSVLVPLVEPDAQAGAAPAPRGVERPERGG